MSEQTYDLLENTIYSLQESTYLLKKSIKIMDEFTSDTKRLSNIFLTRKVFGLVPESDLEDAKTKFKKEIEPYLNKLMHFIDEELKRVNRTKVKMQNKYNLLQIRLSHRNKQHSVNNEFNIDENYDYNEKELQNLAQLKMIRNKKERLKYSLSRINLQEKKRRLSITPSVGNQEESSCSEI